MSTTSITLDRAPLVGARHDRSTRSLIAWTGMGAAELSVATVLLDAPSWARLVTVLAFVCVGPGAAVLSHLPVTRRSTAWALTNVVSLAVWAMGTAVYAWLNVWSPTALLVGLAAATVLSCTWALARGKQEVR
jgi:hypothetical protein